MVEATVERQRRAHNERALLTWTGAALHRAKRLPEAKKLLIGAKAKGPKAQTPEEQLAIVQKWHGAAPPSPTR